MTGTERLIKNLRTVEFAGKLCRSAANRIEKLDAQRMASLEYQLGAEEDVKRLKRQLYETMAELALHNPNSPRIIQYEEGRLP